MLEMATWFVYGFPGIRELEKRRKVAVTISDTGTENKRAVPTFHDGNNILPEVARWYEALRYNNSPSHGVTDDMLDLITEHLLQGDPRIRINSTELCERVNEVIRKAEQKYPYTPATLAALEPQINTQTNLRVFESRKHILRDIEKTLQLVTTDRMRMSSPVVVHGLGGMEKTQMAREYAYSHRSPYSHVSWTKLDLPHTLNRSDQGNMALEYASNITFSLQESTCRGDVNRGRKRRRLVSLSIC